MRRWRDDRTGVVVRRNGGTRPRTWRFAASGAVVVVCVLAVRHRSVSRGERLLFQLVNGLPGALAPPMYVVQLAGGVAILPGLAALALRRGRHRLALSLVLAYPVKQLLEHGVLKRLIDRQRPAAGEPLVILRYDAKAAGLSFPSGHSVVAFAAAALVAPHVKRSAQVTGFALASLVSVARVYLGAHRPLDVVAGAAAGVTIAELLHSVVGDDGAAA